MLNLLSIFSDVARQTDSQRRGRVTYLSAAAAADCLPCYLDATSSAPQRPLFRAGEGKTARCQRGCQPLRRSTFRRIRSNVRDIDRLILLCWVCLHIIRRALSRSHTSARAHQSPLITTKNRRRLKHIHCCGVWLGDSLTVVWYGILEFNVPLDTV